MSPYEMARRECADFVSGQCIWTKGGGCLLARKALKPCKRFEQNVQDIPIQPGADKNPNYFSYVQARQSYLRARKQKVVEVEFRKCPDCGNPLRKRQRVCGQCAKKRRRAAYRNSKKKLRMSVHS